MSFIASFFVVDRTSLAELVRAATECAEPSAEGGSAAFDQAMVEHARGVESEYDWSGTCMDKLLRFLWWRGVRARHRLLRMPGFAEAGLAAMDGLRLLHRELSALSDDEVFMVSIG